jgi:universal stress protein E
MSVIRRILVAVKQPQSRSLPAVAKAAQLARATGSEIELFHAISAPMHRDALRYLGRDPATTELQTRERCLADLERIAGRLRRHGIRVTPWVEWDFPVYEAVVRRAGRSKADLIVAERHAGKHVAPRLLHLTDWELLRHSPVPVLLVKSPRLYRRPAVLAALDPGHMFAKPAALDREILRVAELVTDALHGKLHAVYAYVPIPPFAMSTEPMTAETAASIRSTAHTRARDALRKTLGSTVIAPARRHLVETDPVNGILEVARRSRSAIVVMGAVSRSGLKRVFIGNTAERVLDALACDLLIVKPARFVSGVARARRGARLTMTAARAGRS